jgi:hypothetical protein
MVICSLCSLAVSLQLLAFGLFVLRVLELAAGGRFSLIGRLAVTADDSSVTS